MSGKRGGIQMAKGCLGRGGLCCRSSCCSRNASFRRTDLSSSPTSGPHTRQIEHLSNGDTTKQQQVCVQLSTIFSLLEYFKRLRVRLVLSCSSRRHALFEMSAISFRLTHQTAARPVEQHLAGRRAQSKARERRCRKVNGERTP